MKQIQPKDSLALLWARLGINQAPLVRAPRRATDNERGPCTYMNMNMAAWLENIQGFDVSQFDEEYYSQMTLKQYICANSSFTTYCIPGYNYRIDIPSLALIEGMNLSLYNGVLIPPNTMCSGTLQTWTYGYQVQFPNITSWGKFIGAWITHLNTIQSPFPTNIGGGVTSWEFFLDLNNTGYLDLNDAMQWTTCIGYYGCS